MHVVIIRLQGVIAPPLIQTGGVAIYTVGENTVQMSQIAPLNNKLKFF